VVGKIKIFYANSLLNPIGERILKIDQHLAKLLMKNVVGLFLTHSVDFKVLFNLLGNC